MERVCRLGILLLPILAISGLQVAHVAAGATLSGAAELLSSMGLALALILWIEADARHRHITPCHDFGFLVGVFFPASLVWYAFWSRGRRGVLWLGEVLALLFVPSLAAWAAWLVLYGRGWPR